MPIAIKIVPGTPGAARVEYYACREDVEALLAKGYTASMVYEQMKEEGRVTCSYSAFCDYVRGGGKRSHSRRKGKPKNALPASPGAGLRTGGPISVSQPKNSFPDPRTMDIKDGI